MAVWGYGVPTVPDVRAEGKTVSGTTCACRTCNVTLWLASRPSPAAVATTLVTPTAAVAEAVRVSVAGYALTLEAATSGFADHAAVTPAGSPLTEKLMAPLNDPPVAAVKLTVPEPPSTTVTELDAAVSVSVGAGNTVSA
jgi:hypothetical protein